MDDIYEFENPKYRVASMQIKAIAYDIVIEIAKKKAENSNHEELKNKLTTINDKLIELTESLEEELEKLDQCNQEQEDQYKDSTKEVTPPVKEEVPKQEPIEKQEETVPEVQKELVEKPIVTSDAIKIVPKEEQEPKIQKIPKESTETPRVSVSTPLDSVITPKIVETKAQEVIEKPKINIQPTLETKTPLNQVPEEQTSNLDFPKVVATASTPQLKQFQKTTKAVSKAIMVRQNQLENLRKSRIAQENLLKEKGIFSGEEEKIPTSLTQNTGIEKKELPEEIERQIEDLTVKANIYYNEGEREKAQELYNQIRALSKQTETKE